MPSIAGEGAGSARIKNGLSRIIMYSEHNRNISSLEKLSNAGLLISVKLFIPEIPQRF